MKNSELQEQVLKRVQSNHIWVNAFTIIRPSDDTLKAIGREVVEMLKQKENLLPSWNGQTEGEVHALSELTPVLYLRINAS